MIVTIGQLKRMISESRFDTLESADRVIHDTGADRLMSRAAYEIAGLITVSSGQFEKTHELKDEILRRMTDAAKTAIYDLTDEELE